MTELINAPLSWWVQTALIWNLLFAGLLALLLTCRHGLNRLNAPATLVYRMWWAVPMFLMVTIIAMLNPRTASLTEAIPLSADAMGTFAAPMVIRTEVITVDPWLLGVLCWLPVAVWLLLRLTRNYARVLRTVQPGQGHPPGPATSPLIQSAVCLGMLRPRVVISDSFDQRFTAQQREHLLAHEHVHLRRFDPATRLLAELLRVLCWFNPMVHLAASRFVRDQEMSCDEQVLRSRSRDERIAYARLLGKLTTEHSFNPSLVCTSGSTLKERLMRIAHLNQTAAHSRRLGVLGLLLIASTVAIGAELSTHLPRLTAEAPDSSPQTMDAETRLETAEHEKMLEQEARTLRAEREQLSTQRDALAAQRDALATQRDAMAVAQRAQLDQQREAMEVERDRLIDAQDQLAAEQREIQIEAEKLAREAQAQREELESVQTQQFNEARQIRADAEQLVRQEQVERGRLKAMQAQQANEERQVRLEAQQLARQEQDALRAAEARLLAAEARVAGEASRLRTQGSRAATTPVQLASNNTSWDSGDFEVISRTAPKYPRAAYKDRIEGHVNLEITLLPNDQIDEIRVIESVPEGMFDKAAIAAIKRWELVNHTNQTLTFSQNLEFKLNPE